VATEIELMPMINVFMAIIPLLLLSAAFVPVTVIKTTLPSLEAVETPASDAPLDLAIVIQPEAYLVQMNGKVSARIARPSGEAKAAHEELTNLIRAIAAEHPGHREVRIVSQSRTRYEEIIEVMDIARAGGLPDAALSDAGEAW
jgi:biopolymer transport protein ExbD